VDFRTTACTTADSANPRISAQRISHVIEPANANACPIASITTVTLDEALQPRDAQHGDQLVAEARREVSDAEEAHRRHTTELEAAKAS
jgi:hypothetical protein